MKPDEKALLAVMAATPSQAARGMEFATDLATRLLAMDEKRCLYLLGKWADKGWWEYGVSLRSGWMTPTGLAASKRGFRP